jgi:hypothetical protein
MTDLSRDDLALILEALDSHRYWQLSDEVYRNSGDVFDHGSDDEEKREQIRAVEALEARLEAELELARRAQG